MRLLKEEDVIKAVDKHTNQNGELDNDISVILEEVKEVKNKKNEVKIKDLLLYPVLFALDKSIKEFKDSDDENNKIIYQSLIRSKVVLEKINTCDVEIVGKSFEKFLEDLNEKKECSIYDR